jgi:flagellin
MAAVLNSNIASLYASKNLQSAQSKMADSVERLSSGLRINRAKDDAAGLGIANALTQQINGANQGVRNLNDGISMVQTAEGAISAAQEMAQRILTLATQGANGTMGTTDRAAIKSEMSQLLSAINSIGSRTKFSGNSLLNFDPQVAAVSNQVSLQGSNVTTDVVSLSSNAFKSIGGFSSAAKSVSVTTSLVQATLGTTLNGVTTTDLAVGMSVTGTNIAAGTYIIGIGSGPTAGQVTLSTSTITAAVPNGTVLTFGGVRTHATDPTTVTLATGANPPQNLVGSTAYKITGGTYTKIGTVTTVSGNDVTLSSPLVAAMTVSYTDSIVFSGQLTKKLSGEANDLSLSESVGSTTNTTDNFQMVQRAASAYVTELSTQRSLLGAYQNQIEYTVSNVNELASNLSAARSNVQDTDYASETASLTKGQILQQAATAMLAQANQMPNVILSLLK